MQITVNTRFPQGIIDNSAEGWLLKEFFIAREDVNEAVGPHYMFLADGGADTVINMSSDDIEVFVDRLQNSGAPILEGFIKNVEEYVAEHAEANGSCDIDFDIVGLDMDQLFLSLCQRFPDEIEQVGIMWSYSGDERRFHHGDAGGGATFITKEGIKDMTTHRWLEDQIEAYEAEKTANAGPRI